MIWMVALATAVPGLSPVSAQEAAPPAHHDGAATPDNETTVDYFWRKSDVAFHAGDYPRCIGLHKAIAVLAPDDVDNYGVGAWLMWSIGNGKEADDFLARGLQANPKDPDMWDTAGQQYDLQKKYADAVNAFARAVELSGKDAPELLRRRYAHAAEHAGDLPGSIAIWTQLVKDYPGNDVDKNNLNRVLELQKKGAASAPKAAPSSS
jgi:predicted Zn-dependent protease